MPRTFTAFIVHSFDLFAHMDNDQGTFIFSRMAYGLIHSHPMAVALVVILDDLSRDRMLLWQNNWKFDIIREILGVSQPAIPT